MAYIMIISVAALLIALGNFIADGVYTLAAFALLLVTTVVGVLAVIAVDGVFAFLVRRLPEKWFAPLAPIFSVSEREGRLYKKIKLAKWKHLVPELGCFTGFHKDKLRDSKSARYLGRFLLESNYGVVGHVAGAVLGFLILLLPFLKPRTVALPIAIVNLVLNLAPTAILRANTPTLRRLYARALAREERETENQNKTALT